jgi:hypothetical protein
MVYIFPKFRKYASQLGRKIFPVGFQKKSSWAAKTAMSERDKAPSSSGRKGVDRSIGNISKRRKRALEREEKIVKRDFLPLIPFFPRRKRVKPEVMKVKAWTSNWPFRPAFRGLYYGHYSGLLRHLFPGCTGAAAKGCAQDRAGGGLTRKVKVSPGGPAKDLRGKAFIS